MSEITIQFPTKGIPFADRLVEVRTNQYWGKVQDDFIYAMCKDHFSHDSEDEIISKIFLIGRAYAANIERNPKGRIDNVMNRIIDEIRKADFTTLFSQLKNKNYPIIRQSNLHEIIQLHSVVNKTFFAINKRGNASFASKYLHFHFPNLFFMMDSRAKDALCHPKTKSKEGYCPKWKKIQKPQYNFQYDETYYQFCSALIALRDEIQEPLLTPRQIDNVLLSDVRWNNPD